MKLLLIHDEMLNATLPIFEAHPKLPRIFVFDPDFIAEQGWQRRRLQFIADSLSSIPAVRVFRGSLADVIDLLAAPSPIHIVTQATPNTEILAWLATLRSAEVEFVDAPEFAAHSGSVARFSKYWSSAQAQWFPKG